MANTTTTTTALETARKIWAHAQTYGQEPGKRWAIEALSLDVLKGTEEYDFCYRSRTYFQALMEPAEGWAFAHGFTVYWFPTRSQAKCAWYRAQKTNREWVGWSKPELGPKPEPMTAADAVRWQEGL